MISASGSPIILRDCDNANNQKGCPSGTCLALPLSGSNANHFSRKLSMSSLPKGDVAIFPKANAKVALAMSGKCCLQKSSTKFLNDLQKESCCVVRLVCLNFGCQRPGQHRPMPSQKAWAFPPYLATNGGPVQPDLISKSSANGLVWPFDGPSTTELNSIETSSKEFDAEGNFGKAFATEKEFETALTS